jgi:hypothetical protein
MEAAELWHRVINHLPRSTSLIESEIYNAGACLKIARLLRDLLSSFVLGQFCVSLSFLSNSRLALLYGLLSHFMKFTTLELLGMRYEAYIHFSPQILRAGVDLLSTNFQP